MQNEPSAELSQQMGITPSSWSPGNDWLNALVSGLPIPQPEQLSDTRTVVSNSRSTTSLCPKCDREIPATIWAGEKVIMIKVCPEHGPFTTTVEPDPDFYRYVSSLPDRPVYSGLLVDVTGAEGALDPGAVIGYCREHSDLGPFTLNGGEPTMHPGLFEIIVGIREFSGVGLITNGLKLTDLNYLQRLAAVIDAGGDTLPIAYSVQHDVPIKEWITGNFRQIGKKLSSVFWDITSLEEVAEAVTFYRSHCDVICQIRIKVASTILGVQLMDHKIFVSDILNELCKFGAVTIDTNKGNKSTSVNCTLDGLPIMVVSWSDKENVDLGAEIGSK